jgi:hypothetical protein
MARTRSMMFALLLLPLAAAADDEAAAAIQANAALADFSGTLRGALMERLASGDAVQAVDFCHEKAPEIGAAAEREHGVRLGRVGVRLRNPGNAADGWRAEVLAQFAARVAAGEAPESLRHQSVDPASGTLRVARGIRTEAACLACHGDAVAAPIVAAIKARYPGDQATGFAEGSLRGLAWVEVPMAADDADPMTPDARAPIALSPPQAAALRAEMRAHLGTLQAALEALGGPDPALVADAIPARAGRRRGAGGGAPGADFRSRLPEAWFMIARPMHDALDAAGAAARAGRPLAEVVRHLGEATARCNACHAAFRLQVEPALATAGD